MRFMIIACCLQSALLSACSLFADEPNYNRDVLPILTTACFKCHGPDAGQREAGLRLDMRDAALLELDSGEKAIVPGRPDSSEIIRRATSDDPDEQMPPGGPRFVLTDVQVQTLRKWVAAGANYEQYWAYAPIRRAKGELNTGGWIRNEIDHFVHGKLQAEKLRPATEATRTELLRRLSFDITGLPPTPEDVQAYIADTDSRAYDKAVDQLLRSRHYGERMAMFWLDLVRYADTVGYHGDQEISVSPYRDYVIDAFYDNIPFDQFTREQLGGDLMPDATLRQKIASGYNRLGMMSAEGGVQPKEYLAKYAAERVRNVSLVWMGATMACSECHNHKYDPYTMVDFYSMASFFADIQEKGIYAGAHASGNWGSRIDFPDPRLPELLKPIESQLAKLQQVADMPTPALADAQRAWELQIAESTQWHPLRPQEVTALHGAELKIQADDSILVAGPSAAQNAYSVTVKSTLKGITGFRIEAIPDKSLPKGGPGRAGNGNFVISEFRVMQLAGDNETTPVALQNASASIEQTLAGDGNPYGKWSAASAIDLDVKGADWGWAILPNVGKPSQMVVETKESIGDGGELSLRFLIEQNHTNPRHTVGKFRISASTNDRPLSAKESGSIPAAVRGILAKSADARSQKQQQELAAYFRSIAPSLAATRNKLEQLEKQKLQITREHTRTSLITVAVKPREMRVLPRGNWMDQSGAKVQPTVPHFLRQIDKQGTANRLDLAEWLVAKDNPLTARVFVNRLWKLLFGRGIARSLDDLGNQGVQPTHPELLDWLAAEFIESGWDVKHMTKLIVSSATYRQSSQTDAAARERDPYNELLARQARFRLDAEMVRDNALAVGGLLVRRVGGVSVRPYQPAGYYAHLNFPKRTYKHGSGEDLWRRTVYTHWQRQFLHPSLMAFDAPSREECTVERARSNTPLAALVLMNDPIYVEAARAFAERVLREASKDTAKRLSFVFQQALLREPRPAEARVLTELLGKYQTGFGVDSKEAQALIQIGERVTPKDLDPIELAAWTGLCRVVINTHEFITRN